MLNAQVLVLSLLPLFAGAPMGGRSPVIDMLGLVVPQTAISDEFLVGTWRYTDHFVRWGITDKERPRITRFGGEAFMRLDKDRTVTMLNLFQPAKAHWEPAPGGIVILDPKHPARDAKLLPVKKRDQDRIWVMLPFAGGASGIGMERVSEEEMLRASKRPAPNVARRVQRPPREGPPEPSTSGLSDEHQALMDMAGPRNQAGDN